MVKKGVIDDGDNDVEQEPVEPVTSQCDSDSGYWGFNGKQPV